MSINEYYPNRLQSETDSQLVAGVTAAGHYVL